MATTASAPAPTKPAKGTLFDIGADLQAFDDLLNETDGEITSGEAEIALDAFFAELKTAQAEKLDGYGNLIRREESLAAAAKATAEQFLAKAKALENRAKSLKNRLLYFLNFTGQKKATSACGWQFTVCATGGATPLKMDEGITADNALVDARFVRTVTTKTIDTDAVRKALEAGEQIPWARLGERGVHLRVK